MRRQNLDFIEGFDVVYNGEFDSPFVIQLTCQETQELIRVSIHKVVGTLRAQKTPKGGNF